MTSRVIRQGPGHAMPGMLKEIVVSCDHADCDVSVNDEAVRDGGGLKNMGWTIASVDGKLRHYCPAHPRSN